MSSYVPPSAMGSVMASQTAAEAGTFAKDTAGDIRKYVSEGDWSLRLLALLAGLAMIVTSVMGFLGNVLFLDWISAIFDVYVFFLGILIVLLESGRRLRIFSSMESSIYKNARFLSYIWGRGMIYFVAGTIQIALRDILDIAIGLFVCFVGITYILVGRRTAKKLAEARRSTCTPEKLQEFFAVADVDGKGSLTLDQFRQLISSLGLDLNRRETEAAFMQIDYSHTGRLTYESVQMWWMQDATEHDDFTGTPAVV